MPGVRAYAARICRCTPRRIDVAWPSPHLLALLSPIRSYFPGLRAKSRFTTRVGMKIAIVLLVAVAAVACGDGPKPTTTPTPDPPPMPDPIGANAVIAQCPSPTEVAASDRDLTLTFENDPTIGRTVCSAAQSSRDLTLLQAQVYRVLTVMRQLTFDAPLPWTSNSLYGWLVSSIRGIRLRGDIGTSFCCVPADTIDIQTQNLAALQFPSDFRWVGTLMVLFVHEARHNNG